MKKFARRSSIGALVALLTALVATGVLARQDPTSQRPTFRAGTDLAQVTVRVLDSNRRPVKNLTAKDFRVVVNGVKQPIVAVVPEDLAGPVKPSAAWMRDIAPDVASNRITNPRLIVIILDDAIFSMGNSAIGERKPHGSPAGDLWALKQTKLIGHAIVDQLGPNDLATVVFTLDNRAPRDFTNDRARLLDTIDSFHEGPNVEPVLAEAYSLDTLMAAVQYLREVPERASAIMWVSIGPQSKSQEVQRLISRDTSMADHSMALAAQDQIGALVGQSHVVSVPIYPISPLGLIAPGPSHIYQYNNSNSPLLRLIADASGGHAIVETNAPRDAVPGIFEENSFHYIVGYRPTFSMTDGKFKRVQISVGRPNVIVEPSDRMMLSPTEAEIAMPKRAIAPATTRALSGIVPVTDESLRLALAPFAVASTPGANSPVATIAMALGVEVRQGDAQDGDLLEIETRVFDAEGRKEISVNRQTTRIAPRRGREPGGYDLLSTLSVPKAGRYNVRVSTNSASRGRSGGVYTDVTIPDFSRSALSMSGVVVTVRPGRLAIRPDSGADVIPVASTTLREFSAGDRVSAFARLYWGGDKPPTTATMRAEILNAQSKNVFERTDAVSPTPATLLHSTDYRLDLPIGRLASGEYLLTLRTVTPRGAEIRQDVRFSVR